MTPKENLQLSVQQSQCELKLNTPVPLKEPITPPELEPIHHITSLSATASSYLLTNLDDPEVKRLRRHAIEEKVDEWSVTQTTHRKTENDSIEKGVLLLTQRYENAVKPTIDDIEDYIKHNKNDLQQNDFTLEDFIFLETYLDKTKRVTKDKKLLQLCWLALADKNAICTHCDLAQLSPDAMCTKRKQLFLKGLIQRLKENAVCAHGTYNAIYEAMQCLHPDTKRIMDLAAIHDLIILTVQEILLDYLRSHLDLKTQLQIIKLWLENSAEGRSIFANQDQNLEQQMIDKICEMFNAKGYKKISDNAIQIVKKQFYATPLFLRDFENLEIEFADEIYQTNPNINTLEEHVKFFKRNSLNKKYSDYRAILPEIVYETLIEKLLNEKMDTHKKQLSKSVFEFIIEKLKNDECTLNRFLHKLINNHIEHPDIRFIALFMQLSKMCADKRSPEEIINIMSQHGSAEEMMWLLCHYYHNAKNENARLPFCNLIIFLYKLGVKPEECVRLNVSAAELLITAKLEPKLDVLNCVSTFFQEKHKIKQVKLNDYVNDNVINIYTFCLTIGYSICCIGGLFVSGFIPIVTLTAMLAPVVFISELRSLSGYLRNAITWLLQTSENVPFNSNQKKLYRDFFKSPNSITDKIFSPLYKIKNIVKTSFLSYSLKSFGDQGYAKDYLQPLYGMKHIIKGLFKIASSPLRIFDSNSSLSSIPVQVANGITTMLRGLSEIATTPFTYIIKMPCRILFTLARKQYKQRNMMSLALDLQNEIAEVSNENDNKAINSSQPIDINAPLLDKANHSSKKISVHLFNKAANLHKEYKEFKKTMCPNSSQFQKDEKIKWKEVKSTFFKNMIGKKTEFQDNDKNAIIDYCKTFTR